MGRGHQFAADGPSESPLRFTALLLCFLLSGAASLIYQIVWMGYFSAVFGTAELAVVTVLVAFMGGLAAGAVLIKPLLPRIARPVVVYALLELGIAGLGLALPFGLRLLSRVFVALHGGQPAPPSSGGGLDFLFYLLGGLVVLGIPTALMGATLPLLAQGLVRQDRHLGSRVGLLYGINTVGATAGAILAGFLLIPSLGLHGTTLVAVGGNVMAGLAALALVGSMSPRAKEGVSDVSGASGAPDVPARRPREILVLFAMLVSGSISFTYEVLWTRLLGHVLGGSLYSFATMLASFLAGIALGGLIGGRLATNRARAVATFVIAQAGAALGSLLIYQLLDRVPDLASALGIERSGASIGHAAISALVLLPAATCLGATFPLAVRVLARDTGDAGRVASLVYGWNTVGAILGAVLGGYLLIPALGFGQVLKLMVAGNLSLAALAAVAWDPPLRGARLVAITAGVAAAGLFVLVPSTPPWSLLRASALTSPRDFDRASVIGYSVGRSATVLTLKHRGQFILRTNGLPEAAILPRGHAELPFDATRWLSSLPSVIRPATRSMLVVGLGGGVAIERVPPRIEALDVIELEPEVVRANEALASLRAMDPLADPRLRLIVNDARGALALTDQRYDAVVSQPSHPWTAGASHLYTLEFFELVRRHLTDEGVFVQWTGTHFIDETLLGSLMATLLEVFPHVQLYQLSENFIFAASPSPIEGDGFLLGADGEGGLEALSGWPGLSCAEDVLAVLVLSEAGTRQLARGASVSTDDWNQMAMHAPRLGYRESLAFPPNRRRVFGELERGSGEPRVPVALELDPVYLALRREGLPWSDREAVEPRLAPRDASVLTAWRLLSRGQLRRAGEVLDLLLEESPADEQAIYYRMLCEILAASGGSGGDGAPATLEERFGSRPDLAGHLTGLSEGMREVLTAFLAFSGGRSGQVRRMDAALTREIRPRDPSFAMVADMRVRALLSRGAGDGRSKAELRADAGKALMIIDDLWARQWIPSSMALFRLRAAFLAGEPEAVVGSFWAIVQNLDIYGQDPVLDNDRARALRTEQARLTELMTEIVGRYSVTEHGQRVIANEVIARCVEEVRRYGMSRLVGEPAAD